MSRGALSAVDRIEAAWFTPMPAERIAVVRILVGAYALVRVSALFPLLLQRAANHDALVDPVGLMRLLPAAPSLAVMLGTVALAAGSGCAFIAGLRYRWTAPLFVLSLLAILSYFNSFGMLYHSDHLLVLHLSVLAAAPAADAYSLDALRNGAGSPTAHALDWRYGWPIRMLCALTVSVYLLAGIAKLAAQGWEWGLGDALRAQIAKDALRKQLLGGGGGVLGAWVLNRPWLATGMGLSTLLIELGAPLVLLNQRAGRAWAALAFAMHWGIFFIMGITFRYQLAGLAFLAFFPAEELGRWAARWRRRPR